MERITAKSRVASKQDKEAIFESQRKEKEAVMVSLLVGPANEWIT